MTQTLKMKMSQRAKDVEAALLRELGQDVANVDALAQLQSAVKHGALAGGKRLRPFLVIEGACLTGSTAAAAMPAACAIEMIHSYSLIHDDLPAMDDADTRRGKPSVHKAYDEAIAILAGDALLTDAFTLLAGGAYPPATAMALVKTLAVASGSAGMVGGQMMDLYPAAMTEDAIIGIQARKTGALIEAAAVMGGIIGGADDEQLGALRSYAQALGLAFQIVDDVLDVTQTAEVLGKPAGADDEAGKATFVSLLGLDGARARIAELTEQARKTLHPFGTQGETLVALADELAARSS